ncbi:hypothetical protein QTN47_27230 [Danxiaibacter flavus]|uniref:ATPase n=1 Tax=Danxiaibacter flavus TaxID=3049108 RepID=A0ABV3ZMW9_9BACT|nr:hypothetical protein QNM32_27230 [Chitinophagaceae bacterium DXS]
MEKINQVLKNFKDESTIQGLYDSIELTEEEMQTAIYAAKAEKYWQLEEQKKKDEKIAAMQECQRPWSTEEMFERAVHEARRLASLSDKEHKLDNYVRPVFQLLAQYFTNNPEFEKGDYKLSKGIMIIGNVGVGKTDILKSFRLNKRQCFFPVNCLEIEERIRKNGLDYWKTYTGYVPGHGNTPGVFMQPNIGWMFDDLGVEGIIKDFGNELDALEVIVQNRYSNRERVPFSSLQITTNLNGEMIEKRYGARMRSRLREMFNVIILNGEDRRA